MPFTPLHLGPAILIGIIGWKYLDFPTLLLGSIIVDTRTALVYFGVLDGPLHGVLHTFTGGTLLAFILIGTVTPFRKYIGFYMNQTGFPQVSDDSTIVGAGFLGIYLHLLLDSVLYSDMEPFSPLVQNPLLGIASNETVYAFCGLTGITGLALIPWLHHQLSS